MLLATEMAANQPEQRGSLICVWEQLLPNPDVNRESECSLGQIVDRKKSQHSLNILAFSIVGHSTVTYLKYLGSAC